ncbi:MAG TPA: YMGG-like glycine zipper-containing protein [Vicinamibacterales bacterium]|nr:YMGG-like glycine zipper-containing protein [Vicinamibacterales bacterium]
MTRRHIVALAAVFAFTGVSVIVAAQQRPYRVGDQQVGELLSRMTTGIAGFRASFDQAIDRSRINGSRAEADINQSVSDFKQATDRLRDRVQNRRAGTTDVEDVMRRASVIDGFMMRNALGTGVERDWLSLRGYLDELARAYDLTWNWTGPQNVESRVSDQQVGQLLTRTKKNADRFRQSLDRALDNRSRIDGSREEDDINQLVVDFAEATSHLSDHFDRRQVVTHDVEDVLRRGVGIDSFMQRHQFAVQAENDWLTVRRDLDELARAYNVAWNWSNPPYTAHERTTGLYRRLTGTYQLEIGRGDDPGQAVEQATLALPSNQRRGAYGRLMNRLTAPETIAIDRHENSVTMASSSGPRVTFEADGRARTEQGFAGRTASTRATLYGDQLVVTTTGSGGSDFTVAFEPMDSGRNLRVTRSIYDDYLRQPVTVRSFYRKSSDEAQWDIYSIDQEARSRSDSASVDFGVPSGTRLVATLDTALSTRNAHAEDRFTITTRSPSQYEGAVIEGTVSGVNASGRIGGRADMALNFESIRLRNGRTYQFAGVIDSVRTANGETINVDNAGTVEENSQTEKAVQRGAIGAALGAIIGAISGGGKGAAIGAVIGAGGGAGSVIVQGRDQLDLPRGTELTITSSLPRSQRTSAGGRR